MKKTLLLLALAAVVAGCAKKTEPVKTCIFPGD